MLGFFKFLMPIDVYIYLCNIDYDRILLLYFMVELYKIGIICK